MSPLRRTQERAGVEDCRGPSVADASWVQRWRSNSLAEQEASVRRSCRSGREVKILVWRASSELLAAVFGALGFVGRPRRRAGILADLDLLDRLRDSHAFGPDSPAHWFLVQHISLEVAKLANVELKRKKKVPWASVAFALLIGAPLGFWTYELNKSGFRWFSLSSPVLLLR